VSAAAQTPTDQTSSDQTSSANQRAEGVRTRASALVRTLATVASVLWGAPPASLAAGRTPHAATPPARRAVRAPHAATPPARRAVRAPSTAPLFTLADDRGRPRSLASYRGRPAALFFFCGCPWCVRCAEVWGQWQRSGVLSPPDTRLLRPSFASPVTLAVFSGDGASARDFAARTGLDPVQTVLLPDTSMQVTQLYRADPCPRVFVVDGRGRLCYTNDHKDDAARRAPEMVIASRALAALRAAMTENLNRGKP